MIRPAHRPLIEAIFSQSINGSVTTHPNESNAERQASGLTNQTDQVFFRERLTCSDAVLTSYQTMRLERGAPRTKKASGEPIWYVCVSEQNRSNFAGIGLARQKGIASAPITFSDWPFAPAAAPAPQHPQTSTCIRDFLCQLKKAGTERLALTGGPTLFQVFLTLGCIDELSISICPSLGPSVGASRLADTLKFEQRTKLILLDCTSKDSTIHLRYKFLHAF
jgi:riboflavin biosynthesis pyrimidine reductase